MEAPTRDYGSVGWAIRHVHAGHQLRRKDWPKGTYVALQMTPAGKRLVFVKMQGPPGAEPDISAAQPYHAAPPDLLGNDWMLVDATQPGEYHSS